MSKSNPPRLILGPFTETPHLPEDGILSWGFITVREDHSVQWMQLHFNIQKRTFYTSSNSNGRFYVSSAHSYTTKDGRTRSRSAKLRQISSYIKGDEDLTNQNGGMFLGGSVPEPMSGLLRDLLKKLLKDEDIALVTRLSIGAHR
ncbi:hypothetical protein NMA58_08275 [Rhizobium sp. YTUHZ045]|uniref:hypothetical protein n=1 Tax=Rhizobium sp. YTUHZ045 TaxID=2962888 RepID=UPI003DA8A599